MARAVTSQLFYHERLDAWWEVERERVLRYQKETLFRTTRRRRSMIELLSLLQKRLLVLSDLALVLLQWKQSIQTQQVRQLPLLGSWSKCKVLGYFSFSRPGKTSKNNTIAKKCRAMSWRCCFDAPPHQSIELPIVLPTLRMFSFALRSCECLHYLISFGCFYSTTLAAASATIYFAALVLDVRVENSYLRIVGSMHVNALQD